MCGLIDVSQPGVLGLASSAISWWTEQAGHKTPTLLLRTLKPFAFLVPEQVWTSIAVPDIHAQGVSLRAGWDSQRLSRRTGGLKDDILDIRNTFSKQQTAATVQMMRSAVLPCPSLPSSSGRETVRSALCNLGQVLQGGRSSNAVDWQGFLQDLYSASRVMHQACDEQSCCNMENTAVTSNSKYATVNLLL